MEVNRSMEILYKAVAEMLENNEILKNDIKDVSMNIDGQLLHLRLVDMWNNLRIAIISTILVT